MSWRHWRVCGSGTQTAGSCPSASSWARRKASSLSVLRLECLNFQDSLAVLATLQAKPACTHRSWTQPASRQASMTTTAGRGRLQRGSEGPRVGATGVETRLGARAIDAGDALVFAQVDGQNGPRSHCKLPLRVRRWVTSQRSAFPRGLHGFFRPQEAQSMTATFVPDTDPDLRSLLAASQAAADPLPQL